jgi:hypothetical protein
VTALQGGYRDELAREEVIQVPPQSGACPPEPNAWDAWDGARLDAAADAARPLPDLLPDADAEKWADREPDAPEQDAHPPSIARSAHRGAAAELCRPDAGRFAARSCVVPELAASWEPQV